MHLGVKFHFLIEINQFHAWQLQFIPRIYTIVAKHFESLALLIPDCTKTWMA
jgi:hypothetical protein